jgi:hypothetical protein
MQKRLGDDHRASPPFGDEKYRDGRLPAAVQWQSTTLCVYRLRRPSICSLAPGRSESAGSPKPWPVIWTLGFWEDDGLVSVFGSPSSSAIALSEDEARMLGRATVEPEHLLLAIFRRGRVRDLLRDRVSAGDVYAAIVDRGGVGDDLVLGRVPRSRRLDAVLAVAIDLAAERGDRQVTDVHLLLAFASDPDGGTLLEHLGLSDAAALMDEHFAPQGRPVQDEMSRLQRVRTELGEGHRQIHSMVPAFERFTGDARRAVRAALESASLIEHREVDPFHLLLGCAQVPDSFACRALQPMLKGNEFGPVEELLDRAMRMGPPTAHQATGIFSDTARRLVAEDAVKCAYRAGDSQISTGHLLLAVIDSGERTTEAILAPHTQQLARTLYRGLPGIEDGPDEGELTWIQFDFLIRILSLEFRRVLPPGWTVFAQARGSIHLSAPGARSGFDFAIRPGWIISEFGPGPERLKKVSRWMLERLQAAVMEATGSPWPSDSQQEPAAAYAEIVPDPFNPTLRLGYGDPQAPTLQVLQHDQLLNTLVWRH